MNDGMAAAQARKPADGDPRAGDNFAMTPQEQMTQFSPRTWRIVAVEGSRDVFPGSRVAPVDLADELADMFLRLGKRRQHIAGIRGNSRSGFDFG